MFENMCEPKLGGTVDLTDIAVDRVLFAEGRQHLSEIPTTRYSGRYSGLVNPVSFC